MIACAADHGIFHHDAILAKLDGLTFRYQARAKQNAAARADDHVAANGRVRCHISGWMDLGCLVEMSNKHVFISLSTCRRTTLIIPPASLWSSARTRGESVWS